MVISMKPISNLHEMFCEERRLFPVLYQVAHRCYIQLDGKFTLRLFTQKYVHLLRTERIQVSHLNDVRFGFVINRFVYLKITAANDDPGPAKDIFCQQLNGFSSATIAFVLQPALPANWFRIQLPVMRHVSTTLAVPKAASH